MELLFGLLGHITNSFFSFLKTRGKDLQLDEAEQAIVQRASYQSFITHTIVTILLWAGAVWFSESYMNDANLYNLFSSGAKMSAGWWFGSLSNAKWKK